MDKQIVCIASQRSGSRTALHRCESDLSKRLEWHNAGQNIHTAQHRPWSLVVSIEFTERSLALEFERYLESGSGQAFAKRHLP